jgi:hypothetical protein
MKSNMKKSMIVSSFATILALGASSAATTFTGANGTDFNDAGNWDNGLPSSGSVGTIDGGHVADMNSNSGADLELIVGANASAGTLNLTSGTLDVGGKDIKVGVGANSTGTVTVANGSTLRVAGGGADLFIGDSAGGQGFVTIASGGTLDANKALEIINGNLTLQTGASIPDLKDEFVVDNNGTIAFQTDGSSISTIYGGSLAVELGSTSTLDMQLGGTYSVGDSWTILTDVSGFSGVNGGDGTGVFGTVYDSTDAGNIFSVDYGTTTPGAVVVTLTAVPEPTSAALLGLGGLTLILRRRK